MSTLEKGFVRARARSGDLRSVDERGDEDAAKAGQAGLDIRQLATVRLNSRHLAEHRVVTDEVSAASAAYKMLRTRLLHRMQRNGWKTLAVTGTCPDEGKSLTAVNLSISLARDLSTSVVLVDFDLRKPSLHRHLGIVPSYGIHDYFRGAASLEQVAVRPGFDRLAVILNDRPVPDSSELLRAPQAAKLVEEVRRGPGRIAVFDLPPVLASDDLLAFSPLVDAVLLVLAPGKTKREDLLAAYDLLEDKNIVGVVLNRSDEDVAAYYYYGQR